MKIKTKKKLNLPELIKHVWDNEVYPSVWRSEESPSDKWEITFFEGGMFRGYNGFHDYDTFAVTVEEELTEETEFSRLWSVFYNEDTKAPGTSRHNYLVTIDEVMGDDTYHEKKLLAIYHKDILIWSKEHGIPESGVLEAGAE